jgi:hypothetical protein
MKPMMNTRPLIILSRASFFLGVLFGFVLSVIAIWNNLESTDYYFSGVKYAPFKGLSCPLMIAPTEKGIVTAVFKNPTNDEDDFFYRAEISGKASSTRQIEGQIAVPPHQTKNVQFTVDANDVDLLFFILVKLTILPNSVHPSQESVCGMLVANILSLTGLQVSLTALFLSIAGIVVGLSLWQETGLKADQDRRRIAQVLGSVVLLTILVTYLGWWAVATVLVVVIILLMVISLRFALA